MAVTLFFWKLSLFAQIGVTFGFSRAQHRSRFRFRRLRIRVTTQYFSYMAFGEFY